MKHPTTKRVLVIGIKSFAFDAYRTRFIDLGIEIDECEFHATAIDMMRIRRYDVVMIQLMITAGELKDGLDTLEFVRKEHPEAKVMVISTCGNEIEKEQIYNHGAAYYLDAPVFAPDVFKALRELAIVSGNESDTLCT